ncbi:PAS domain-containing protein [Dactylosporangium maewongense]|uniref:PAS domain-containing protein n=1 Tax=Dactylosporangium maewongense TaxID=634393 RepID=A0ABP4M0H5_9ACTN
MREATVAPTGQERMLGEDELIVTKTDLRGVITYANPVFLRMSALTAAEAIGSPHNVIRHPDMPRCVFKLLWDTIGRGDELFAYVVNLARDGAHYWVLAHVTPSFDARGARVGYHSNRRRPDRSAVAAVTGLYARLRAEERRHGRPQEAIEASTRLLERELAEQGRTYDEFFWSLTGAVTA